MGYGTPQATDAPAPTNQLGDYSNPKEYIIGGISLVGTRFLDPKIGRAHV